MDSCPHCGAGFSYGTHAGGSVFVRWACESNNRGTRGDKCRIDQAIAICRRHDSPAVNVATHALAGKLLAVLTGEERTHA